jgi:hypothetical protein
MLQWSKMENTMEIIELMLKAWPVFVAFIMIVVLFAKADMRLGVLEEKVKTLFELYNKQGK